ncbi:MarR family transcriptional regulator [Gordonia sp. SID5947]|uniref:MarR family winged helix-turn-helix transcriptional regulator n=1 Tax=Gordonia sp. SID5947 TaxID=2690315 RepID=UPI001369721D|nr:MarR family winged helix-turn-helix transcriptional regulator [Gordonia sp. SID5947]MYR07462.1 MarR family transcriptional regulator [Gordonia sp. SID5947]
MPVPEGLSEEQYRVWLTVLVGSMLLINHLDERLSAEHGISHAEYRTMVSIARQGPHRMSELAQAGIVSRSGISRLVGRLVASGYVEQFAEGSDGRSRLVRLTDAGRDLVAAASADHAARIRRHFFDLIDQEEARALESVFGKVDASLTGPLQ